MPRPQDLASIPACLGVEPDSLSFWAAIGRAVADRRSRYVVDTAVLLGLACTEVDETTDRRPILTLPAGTAPPSSLDGLVVANLASLWAGPLAGDVLSPLGARVIKVESISRPDGSRRARPFFEALNDSCESLVVDLASPTGRSQLHRQLRATADTSGKCLDGTHNPKVVGSNPTPATKPKRQEAPGHRPGASSLSRGDKTRSLLRGCAAGRGSSRFIFGWRYVPLRTMPLRTRVSCVDVRQSDALGAIAWKQHPQSGVGAPGRTRRGRCGR